MKNQFMDAIMNPIRTRIIQYLSQHEAGTAGEMKEVLSDVPIASLYRHLKILLDAGCILIVEKRQIRGTTEKVYQLNPNPLGELSNAKLEDMIQSGLYSLMNSFHRYFVNPGHDPNQDMVCFRTVSFLLTDKEYLDFLQKLGTLLTEAMSKEAGEGRQQRRFTFISLPDETK